MPFEKKPIPQSFANVSMERINNNTRRVRTLEQRLDGVSSRMESLEERIIEEIDVLKKGVDRLFLDIKEVSKSLAKIRAENLELNKNMEKTAKKTELRELEGLLDLYNPIKSKFVTTDQVKRLIERDIKKV
jgi:chromosome segregation ATPase